jgi:hypothetical protein
VSVRLADAYSGGFVSPRDRLIDLGQRHYGDKEEPRQVLAARSLKSTKAKRAVGKRIRVFGIRNWREFFGRGGLSGDKNRL